MKTLIVQLALASAVCLAIGCDNPEPKAPVTPEPTAEPAPQPTAEAIPEDKNPDEGNIRLGPKLKELCSMPTARFGFDSANLSPEAGKSLEALAECFVSGPAVGKGMRIVGHTDPRGPEDYNMALGKRRADSVAKHLTKRGVDKSRIASSSMGEQEATGTDDASWEQDRKVQIFLAE
jgi:peptidoglycan-associated lipoprotein